MYPGKFYFEESSFKLIDNNTFDTLKEFEEKSFDMIFADPPYFLSNKDWIHECYRVLKDDGTIWISRDSTQYIFNRNGTRRRRI